jgi:hypothetical protein
MGIRQEPKKMTTSMTGDDSQFNPPGSVKVSPSALQLARDLDHTVRHGQRGDWVVSFDWAPSVSVKRGKDRPAEEVGPCLMLGAYRRDQIPPSITQTIDGLEFAVKIPADVLDQSAERLIDADESLLFKLALR